MVTTKEWKQANPELLRRQKQRYYDRLATDDTRGRQQWAAWEDEQVLAHAIPDRELATQLHRTVRAIHVRRSLLRRIDTSFDTPTR